MKYPSLLVGLFSLLLLSCSDQDAKRNSSTTNSKTAGVLSTLEAVESAVGTKHFEGTFSDGYEGAKISFDISEDGTKLENLIFDGHWTCNHKVDQTKVGPEGSFTVENGKVNGHLTEPEGGGATAWRYELTATINGSKAEGSFRMNNNSLGCDTYELNWTAKSE